MVKGGDPYQEVVSLNMNHYTGNWMDTFTDWFVVKIVLFD